ncbi:MAG TPA: hypothetical protein EYP63_04900 [Desulfotomaculum sp.]|nr:hypothetical protein [Desulfotomaculum sp.]
MSAQLFHEYGLLAAAADKAFRKMEEEYGECIKCRRGCTDCCHAVFGLFFIEAAFINCRFNELGRAKRAKILLRAAQADKDLERLQRRLAYYTEDPQMQAYALSRERLRCPLLNENEDCDLYPFRPITCRVYGIPVAIHGRAQVCWKAGFERGKSYPAFDLDAVYERLYLLSKKLLAGSGEQDTERASYLVSVSKSLQTPLRELIGMEVEG